MIIELRKKKRRGEMVPVARLCLVAQRIAQTLGLGRNESLHLCSRSLRPRSETNEVIASLVESQEMEDGVDDVMDFLHEGHVRGVFEVHWRGRSFKALDAIASSKCKLIHGCLVGMNVLPEIATTNVLMMASAI